ncbi:hypothetical protein B9T62_18580 [Paenibacillus donghaensis]|uniref:Uncharacterized protein n=2 Tax=Paenibacillus donghaensis TaxID=414771 RepID=A0A2Z2KAI4_9BACL|nr:hypothetical protein B9T62_18580 [Paenibacillus donghaensis]
MDLNRISKFIKELDKLSDEHGIYIDLNYDSVVGLRDEDGKVVAEQFQYLNGLGYECFEV